LITRVYTELSQLLLQAMAEVERISTMLRAFSGDIRLRICDLQDLFVRHRLRDLANRFRTTRKAVAEEKDTDGVTKAMVEMEADAVPHEGAPAPREATSKQQKGGAFLLDLMGR
jgi:hypothetical protein